MAEQRATGGTEMKLAGNSAPLTFVLTSIAWREAWKYRDRAYRYCLHDMGHAWQGLALAAQAIGCDGFATGRFPDDEVSEFIHLAHDEWPMLVVEIRGSSIPATRANNQETVWYGGIPNELSVHQVSHPLIDAMHRATKPNSAVETAYIPSDEGSGEIKLPSPALSNRAFGEVARMRRSALDFRGGSESISLAQLSAILAAATQPLAADFADDRFIQLYLYVHRVDELEPGVYRYWPRHGQLELIRSGDQRVAAAGLSLAQDLAGNACVAFSMIGDLDRAARAHGDRGYRYVHFEAGAIGHHLYIAAEALGLGATGIGAFYDDEVNRYLNLTPEQGQVVYHFAIGYPVHDSRIGA